MCRVLAALALFCALMGSGAAYAQNEDPFKGKTLSVIVGYAPGGGFDQYARLVAEFLPRYLPGQPHAIVQNMPGSSSIVATRYILRTAPKDGTAIGIPNHNLFLDQLLGRGALDFDMTKFNWIGRLGTRLSIGILWRGAGLRSIEDAKSREVYLAAAGSSGGTDYLPAVLNAVLGTRFKLIKGYTGQTDMYLALERGEAQGMASAVWQDLKSGAQAAWRRDGLVEILYVVDRVRAPDLPDVPALPELAAKPEDRALLEMMSAADTIGRSFYVAPSVAPERVAQLRRAFAAMVQDREMLAAAKQRNVEINPMAAEDLSAFLARVVAAPPELVARLRAIIGG